MAGTYGHRTRHGHFAIGTDGSHAPSGVAYDANNQPVNQLSQDWMAVESNPGGKLWNQWIGQIDTVDTVTIRHKSCRPSGAAVWRVSSHKWNIEWKLPRQNFHRLERREGVGEVMHEAKIDAIGTATIKKGNAGPFQRTAGQGTSPY